MLKFNNYWSGNGNYKGQAKFLDNLVPVSGPCLLQNFQLRQPVELYRMMTNLYYEVYRNGGLNLSRRGKSNLGAMASYVEVSMQGICNLNRDWLQPGDGDDLAVWLCETNWKDVCPNGHHMRRLERVYDIVILNSFVMFQEELDSQNPTK